MSKAILCAIIVLVSTAGRLTVYAGTPYIGHWALTLPAESAGWLGVEEADGQLQASILWGGGSVRPVNSVTVEGDRLVITRVQVQRGGADRGKKTTETITASLSGDSLKLVNRTPFVPARSTCRAIIRTSTTGT